MIEKTPSAGVVHFHGHLCPGLALEIRAADIALEKIGPHDGDEEVVAIVGTDACGVDGIQFLTGCTLGKGNLIHATMARTPTPQLFVPTVGPSGSAGGPERRATRPCQEKLGAKVDDGQRDDCPAQTIRSGPRATLTPDP